MKIIEQLNEIKEKEYVVNSKFYVVVHLPLTTYYDFDLIFLGNQGTIIYREHIQNLIESIEIIHDRKVAYIVWKNK